MRVIKAGVTYFGLVFGAGFVLGVVRTLWVVPQVGEMWAELLEAPLMLVVIVVAARWVVPRFELRSRAASLGTGCFALGLLLFAELTLVLGLRGMALSEYVESRDPVSASVYLAMLVAFALAPIIAARWD
jgi:hypothetical protein